MRKPSAILILSIVIIAQFGYYAYNMYQVHEAKEAARLEILKQIPEKFLTKIQLTENTIVQWEEEGKEFKLNGEMYDVVHVKQDGEKIYMYCFSDENETEVVKKLEAAVKDSLDNSKNPQQKHFETKLASPDWLFVVQDLYKSDGFSKNTAKNSFTNKPSLSSGNIQKIYSPPDFII